MCTLHSFGESQTWPNSGHNGRKVCGFEVSCLTVWFSGAGKTTLLNALNGRNLNLFNVKGAVKINNKVADVKTITTTTAYVQQEDLLWPSMTAREHLVFQAMVRMGNHFSLHDKAKRINQVLREVGEI